MGDGRIGWIAPQKKQFTQTPSPRTGKNDMPGHKNSPLNCLRDWPKARASGGRVARKFILSPISDAGSAFQGKLLGLLECVSLNYASSSKGSKKSVRNIKGGSREEKGGGKGVFNGSEPVFSRYCFPRCIESSIWDKEGRGGEVRLGVFLLMPRP